MQHAVVRQRVDDGEITVGRDDRGTCRGENRCRSGRGEVVDEHVCEDRDTRPKRDGARPCVDGDLIPERGEVAVDGDVARDGLQEDVPIVRHARGNRIARGHRPGCKRAAIDERDVALGGGQGAERVDAVARLVEDDRPNATSHAERIARDGARLSKRPADVEHGGAGVAGLERHDLEVVDVPEGEGTTGVHDGQLSDVVCLEERDRGAVAVDGEGSGVDGRTLVLINGAGSGDGDRAAGDARECQCAGCVLEDDAAGTVGRPEGGDGVVLRAQVDGGAVAVDGEGTGSHCTAALIDGTGGGDRDRATGDARERESAGGVVEQDAAGAVFGGEGGDGIALRAQIDGGAVAVDGEGTGAHRSRLRDGPCGTDRDRAAGDARERESAGGVVEQDAAAAVFGGEGGDGIALRAQVDGGAIAVDGEGTGGHRTAALIDGTCGGDRDRATGDARKRESAGGVLEGDAAGAVGGSEGVDGVALRAQVDGAARTVGHEVRRHDRTGLTDGSDSGQPDRLAGDAGDDQATVRVLEPHVAARVGRRERSHPVVLTGEIDESARGGDGERIDVDDAAAEILVGDVTLRRHFQRAGDDGSQSGATGCTCREADDAGPRRGVVRKGLNIEGRNAAAGGDGHVSSRGLDELVGRQSRRFAETDVVALDDVDVADRRRGQRSDVRPQVDGAAR